MKTPVSSIVSKKEQNVNPLTRFANIFNRQNIIQVNTEKYVKLDVVGRGGNSIIYKVMDNNGQLFAIKEISLQRDNSELIDSVMNEIELLSDLLDEQYIIDYIDSENHRNKIDIVLELGDTDLSKMIHQQISANTNYLRYIWQQMLLCVKTIHDYNIIHGALRPSSFLLVKGTLKLIDFGSAKVISGDGTSTVFDKIFADLKYRAPEARMSARNIKLNRAADVWSLGAILRDLVNGYVDDLNDLDSERLEDLLDLDDLSDIIQSCCQENPHDRPTIEDLLEHPYITHVFINNEGSVDIVENVREFVKQIQNGNANNFGENEEESLECLHELAQDLFDGRQMEINLY